MESTNLSFTDKLLKVYYQKKMNPLLWPLVPFSLIMNGICRLRRMAYQWGMFSSKNFPVPIIIVGNLSLGGTGKTPLVIHLAKLLTQHGYRPGIVSRGYKGTGLEKTFVNAGSDPKQVGDEPVLLAKRLFCPIVVDPNRVSAVQAILESYQVDIIIADDGLQHYALGRSLEIVVVDGKRRFGNEWCIPAGPLREPMSRLKSVDFVVTNGPENFDNNNEYDMELRPRILFNGRNPSEQTTLAAFHGKTVHAVAGIGHPERFFDMLRSYGLTVIPHPFSDHYNFEEKDIQFGDADCPVMMTEKDAVKCGGFMKEHHWVLSVDAIMNPLFDARLLTLLQDYRHGQKVT